MHSQKQGRIHEKQEQFELNNSKESINHEIREHGNDYSRMIREENNHEVPQRVFFSLVNKTTIYIPPPIFAILCFNILLIKLATNAIEE
jgi:hypothetical protein